MATDTDILNSLSSSPKYANLKPQIEGLRSQKHSDTDILNSLIASPKYSVLKPQVEQFRGADAKVPSISGEVKDQGTIGQKIARTVAPYARPALEMGGTLAGGALGTAAEPGGGTVVGAGLGYAAGRQGANALEEYAGMRKPTTLAQAATQAVKDVPVGAAMEAGGQVVGKVLPPVVSAVGKGAKQVLGKMTGAGTGAVEEAIKSGEKTGFTWNPLKSRTDFDKALRGEISGEDIVDNAKGALQSLKEMRTAEYQKQLAKISGEKSIDASPVFKKMDGLMKQYNIKTNPDGTLDLSRVAMGKTGRKDIEEVINTISDWGTQKGDRTPVGLDTLKRQLDDFYSDSSQARQFVTSLRNTVRSTISNAVPEYDKMTKGYSEATRLIKDMESGLMIRKQGMTGRVVADQTLRRLTSAMRDNFELRKDLLETLGNKAGQDLSGQTAGYAMRSITPLGISGTGPAILGEAALAHYVHPAFWPVLAASSPRVSGEFLRMFGKALGEFPETSQAIGKAIAYGSVSKANEDNILKDETVKSPVPQPRADGGPVEPGQPYKVGERGEELFTPSQPETPKEGPHARKKGETLKQWTDRLYKAAGSPESPAETEGTVIKGAHGSY